MLTRTTIIIASLLSITSFAGETIILNEQFSSPSWKSKWKFNWDNNTGKQGAYFFKHLSGKKFEGKQENGCVESVNSSQNAPAQATLNNTSGAEELIVEFKFAMIGHYNASRLGVKLFDSKTGASLQVSIGVGSKKTNYVSISAYSNKKAVTNLTAMEKNVIIFKERDDIAIPTHHWHKASLIYTKEGTASLSIDGKQLLEINIDSPKFKNVAFNRILFGGNVYPQSKSRPIFSSIKIIKIND